MKKIVAIIGCLMAGNSMADTAFFSTFEIAVPDQWTWSVEVGPVGAYLNDLLCCLRILQLGMGMTFTIEGA